MLLSPRVSDGPRCCYMDGYVILNTQGVLDSVVAPAKGIRKDSINASAPQYIRITNTGYPDKIVRMID